MWPYYYHGYFDSSSYSATTVSNGAILTKLTNQITGEQQYIPRKLAVGQSAACKKNNQLLQAQKLNIDQIANVFQESKMFHQTMFSIRNLRYNMVQETYLFETSCHSVIYQQFRCYNNCCAL